jgi:hypothetical protein
MVMEKKKEWTSPARDWAFEMVRVVRMRVDGRWEARARYGFAKTVRADSSD